MLLAPLTHSSSRPNVRSWARLFVLAVLASFGMAISPNSYAAGPTGLLNDTGQTLCNNGSAMMACDAATTGDASALPRQDGRFGRDAASPVKVGGGVAGFDFTRVCQDGSLNCTGAANLTMTVTPGDWVCTKDNVTNLIWSLGSGRGNQMPYGTTELPNIANIAKLCGYDSGWRLPTRKELLSIVNVEASRPAIDGAYFPGTQSDAYWSSDSRASSATHAWYVSFSGGSAQYVSKTSAFYVRLVRDGT